MDLSNILSHPDHYLLSTDFIDQEDLDWIINTDQKDEYELYAEYFMSLDGYRGDLRKFIHGMVKRQVESMTERLISTLATAIWNARRYQDG